MKRSSTTGRGLSRGPPSSGMLGVRHPGGGSGGVVVELMIGDDRKRTLPRGTVSRRGPPSLGKLGGWHPGGGSGLRWGWWEKKEN